MTRIWASASRRDAVCRAAILSGVMLATAGGPSAAQTTVIGGSAGSDVVVNESVLDALGPPSTLPGPMLQDDAQAVGPSGLRPFRLHPPREHRTTTISKPQPTEDQAQQTASRVSPTAIPRGKESRTAKAKSPRIEQASAATAAATPQPTSSAPPPPQPAPSAPAGARAPQPAAAPAPAASGGPINSIVRRYPAGTGAAMLAATQPAASAPATPPQATTPAPPAAAPTPASTPPPSSATTAAAAATPAAPPSAPSAPAVQAAAPTVPAPATTAQPGPASAAAAAPTQVASLPPGGGLPSLPTQIVFAANATDMPDQAKATLDRVIATMKADEQIRVQLIAYASGLPDQANAARRTSLSRAVGVRAYLVEQGVKSVRIDVRAMGNRSDSGGPQDRVDIVPIDR